MNKKKKRTAAGRILPALLSAAADILYPRKCPLCQKLLLSRERYVCMECSEKLPLIVQPYCLRCGRPVSDETKEYCFHCEKGSWHFDEGRCVYRYEGALREAVLEMKYKNRRDYIPFFAASMAAAHRDFMKRIHPEMIIPVPLHKKKAAQRGFDQCALIAGLLSEYTGIPVRTDILYRDRYTKAQKGLLTEERKKNLEGAFGVREGTFLPGTAVLLIDDILTTGTTLNECAFVLKKAGAGSVCFLALSAPDTGQ